ncbi:ABC transporter permease [Paenibacillus sp. Marseille-Q4541]|uniref:ABC transporter permease n=1 Tax=Paenibacillus sp. Marseille-Q4541 TaxID=2831522 RepID=UPI001BA8B13B|nr:ABC transporter permease [Paenibacillus sp. Marseille-Q4541]
MTAYLRMLSAERLKLIKSPIWLLVLVSPLIALLVGFMAEPSGSWTSLINSQVTLHGMLLLPIFTGVFASYICRFEHAAGGWKQVLVLPVSRASFYAAKLTVIMVLLLMMQLLLFGSILIAGGFHEMMNDIPWAVLLKSISAGWIASLPLAALQLFVSMMWNSFGAPLGINFMLTVPNLLIVNSEKYAPYYPWAQPFLVMMPTEEANFGAFLVPYSTLVPVIFGTAVLFVFAGMFYFKQKEV